AGTMGTDTGGSIRIPASLCGCVGLKPTYGRVSKAGVMMMSWQLDHPGPLTKTVRDAALMLTAVQGYDPADAATTRVGRVDYASSFEEGLQGLVIGVPRAYYWESLDPEVAAACEAALKVFNANGAVVREVDVPSFAPHLRAAFDMVRTEAIEFHAERLAANPDGFSPELHAIFAAGPLSGLDYVKAQRGVYGFTQDLRAAFEPVSVLVMPTTPGPATSIGGSGAGIQNTAPFNATGMPALSLPCGFTAAGLPIGLQIVGREFDEWTVIRAAHGYEQATDWHNRRPVL
ncbi:MAG: amidase, partial [Anaerolineaceae bacterium]